MNKYGLQGYQPTATVTSTIHLIYVMEMAPCQPNPEKCNTSRKKTKKLNKYKVLITKTKPNSAITKKIGVISVKHGENQVNQ